MPNDLELSLGAGGLKGAFQVGLLSALDKRHIDRVNKCSGVSTGALTGACLMSAAPKATLQAYYRTALAQPLVPKGNKYWRAAKQFLTHKNALYDGVIFERLVREVLSPIAHNKSLLVGVKPMASRLQHSVELTHATHFDAVVQSVLASAAIMGVFPPRTLHNLGPCVDGGFISGLHLPHLRETMRNRNTRVLMVVNCNSSCAANAQAEAEYLGESNDGLGLEMDSANPTLHTAVMHWVDHSQKLGVLGDISRLRHELQLDDMPDGVFGALYDGLNGKPHVFNASDTFESLPSAPSASQKPMAVVYCAPKLRENFAQFTNDIALMTGEQEKRTALLTRYHTVGASYAPDVSRVLDLAARWTQHRRHNST